MQKKPKSTQIKIIWGRSRFYNHLVWTQTQWKIYGINIINFRNTNWWSFFPWQTYKILSPNISLEKKNIYIGMDTFDTIIPKIISKLENSKKRNIVSVIEFTVEIELTFINEWFSQTFHICTICVHKILYIITIRRQMNTYESISIDTIHKSSISSSYFFI